MARRTNTVVYLARPDAGLMTCLSGYRPRLSVVTRTLKVLGELLWRDTLFKRVVHRFVQDLTDVSK